MDIISTNKRFELMDRRELDKLKQERDMQKTDDMQHTFKMKDGEIVGAAYYLTGNVTDYKSFAFDKKGKLHQASFKAQVRLINVQTGQVIYSELISPRNSPVKPLSSKNEDKWSENPIDFEAKKGKLFSYPNGQRALEDIENQFLLESKTFIDRLLSNVFPIYLKIYSVKKATKKGVPLELEILGGSSAYLFEKDNLKIVEETTIKLSEKESTKKYTELGTVRILKIEGESFSVVRITKGNKAIIGQKLASGAVLKVVK